MPINDNVEIPPIPAELKGPPQQPMIQGPGALAPVQTAWQQSGFIRTLWPLGDKLLDQMKWSRAKLVWLKNHPKVAESIEIILDAAGIPCPSGGQDFGKVVMAGLVLVAFFTEFIKAVGEDMNERKSSEYGDSGTSTGEGGDLSPIKYDTVEVEPGNSAKNDASIQEGKPTG